MHSIFSHLPYINYEKDNSNRYMPLSINETELLVGVGIGCYKDSPCKGELVTWRSYIPVSDTS